MNDLDPLWLRSFVAIADCGSVTGAARRVHRTQSAVSAHLKQLESTLGTALATRTSPLSLAAICYPWLLVPTPTISRSAARDSSSVVSSPLL